MLSLILLVLGFCAAVTKLACKQPAVSPTPDDQSCLPSDSSRRVCRPESAMWPVFFTIGAVATICALLSKLGSMLFHARIPFVESSLCTSLERVSSLRTSSAHRHYTFSQAAASVSSPVSSVCRITFPMWLPFLVLGIAVTSCKLMYILYCRIVYQFRTFCMDPARLVSDKTPDNPFVHYGIDELRRGATPETDRCHTNNKNRTTSVPCGADSGVNPARSFAAEEVASGTYATSFTKDEHETVSDAQIDAVANADQAFSEKREPLSEDDGQSAEPLREDNMWVPHEEDVIEPVLKPHKAERKFDVDELTEGAYELHRVDTDVCRDEIIRSDDHGVTHHHGLDALNRRDDTASGDEYPISVRHGLYVRFQNKHVVRDDFRVGELHGFGKLFFRDDVVRGDGNAIFDDRTNVHATGARAHGRGSKQPRGRVRVRTLNAMKGIGDFLRRRRERAPERAPRRRNVGGNRRGELWKGTKEFAKSIFGNGQK